MKLEIIREKEFGQAPWYILKADDKTIDFSRKLEEIEAIYEEVKKDPSVINPSKIVLKSEEINVNL